MVAETPTNTNKVLEVKNLKVYFKTRAGPVHAVEGVSFSLDKGESLGIVGESGSGKSVTSLAVLRLLPMPPAEIVDGEVFFNGRDLVDLSEGEMRKVRGGQIAMIFQDPMTSLNPVLTIERQLTEPLELHLGLSGSEARNRARELLEAVGIPEAARRLKGYPHQFSGGMRQRASIALALALEPALVIADEPVTALDVIVQRQVLDVMRDLQQRLNLAMILVTHDMAVVAYACDRAAVMYAGKIVESGPVGAVLEAPFHPYTMGLTHAFPDLRAKEVALVPIEGAPPSLLEPPHGCRFADRCPFVQNRCRAEAPPLVQVADDHLTACWRSDAAVALREQAARPETWAA